MKHMKLITRPAKSESVLDKTTCDICGQVFLTRSMSAVNEVIVEQRKGVSYPEGGSGVDIEFDICGGCFETVLVPFLQSKGACS